MVEKSAVVERGVVTATAETSALAVRRAEVIGKLAGASTVGLDAADAAAIRASWSAASQSPRKWSISASSAVASAAWVSKLLSGTWITMHPNLPIR